jgi:hypothetical protein
MPIPPELLPPKPDAPLLVKADECLDHSVIELAPRRFHDPSDRSPLQRPLIGRTPESAGLAILLQ